MKITDIKTSLIKIPLQHPFKTALRTVEYVEDTIVKLYTDGEVTGYGEAPPTAVITGETNGSIQTAIAECIRPALVGCDLWNLEEIFERLDHCMVKNTSAKAAVDMAVYDAYAKMQKQPLYRVLGGYRSEIETDLTISVNPVEEMVKDSLEAVERGFHILKVKVGKEGLKDVLRMEEIRKAVGKDIILRVDANQGWNAKQAVSIIRAMEDKGLDIELVEQPVSAHDFEGMKYVTQNVTTKILADESVFCPEDAVRIIQERAADLINIKLMKTGGIHQAIKICDIAALYGVECMIGCMLESKISVSAAAHFAGAKKNITMADLDGPSLCKTDPYEGGPQFIENRILLNETPGLGILSTPCL